MVFCTSLRALVLFGVLASAALAQRPLTLEDLDGVRSDGTQAQVSFDLSPDGRQLAVEKRRRLSVVDAAAGKVLQELGDGVLPLFSPQGKRLAFWSNRTGAMQLWVWDGESHSVRQITNFAGGVDPDVYTRIRALNLEAFRPDWSPDGANIVFASRVAYPIPRAAGAPLVLDKTASPNLALAGVFANPGGLTGALLVSSDGRNQIDRTPKPGEMAVSRLFVVNVRTAKVQTLDGGPGHLFHPAWSPDGNRIAYGVVDEKYEVFHARAGELRLLDLSSGQVSTLADRQGIKYRPRWSPQGLHLAYLAGASISDSPAIRIVDARNGSILRETKPRHRIRKYDWARSGGSLLLSYDDRSPKLGRLAVNADAVTEIRSDFGLWWWSEARDSTLGWMRGLDGDDVWVLPKGAKAAEKRFTVASAENNENLQLGRTESIAYRTSRGFVLEGKLLYPPDYVEGKRYPLIVDVYPTNSGGTWMHFIMGNHAWAAAGYMVFKPHQVRAPHVWTSCSGDPGYCAAGRGPQGWDVMTDDVMSGVDAVIARGLVEPERMCVYGHSNGGGGASYLITKTNRFRCAVIVAPVFPSWVGAPSLLGMWDWVAHRAGMNPFDDPQAYIELSATFRAKNIETPVLLAVGDNDGAFLLGAIELYQAMRFAGKDITFLRYPGQDHVFRGPAVRDFWQREMAFFKKYLKAN